MIRFRRPGLEAFGAVGIAAALIDSDLRIGIEGGRVIELVPGPGLEAISLLGAWARSTQSVMAASQSRDKVNAERAKLGGTPWDTEELFAHIQGDREGCHPII